MLVFSSNLSASRSSQRNSLSNMFDRSGRSSKFIDENPYSSLTSTVSYADIPSVGYGAYDVGYGQTRNKEPSPRLTYSEFNQYRISPVDNHMKSATIDFHAPKNEPPPDYDTTSCSSISTIYKDTRQSKLYSKSNWTFDCNLFIFIFQQLPMNQRTSLTNGPAPQSRVNLHFILKPV